GAGGADQTEHGTTGVPEGRHRLSHLHESSEEGRRLRQVRDAPRDSRRRPRGCREETNRDLRETDRPADEVLSRPRTLEGSLRDGLDGGDVPSDDRGSQKLSPLLVRNGSGNGWTGPIWSPLRPAGKRASSP